MRSYIGWLVVLFMCCLALAPQRAEACSRACYCIPGHWVPKTNEVPFNAEGIFWIKHVSDCGKEAYTPKPEDFKFSDMSTDPPTELKFTLKEPTEGVYLLAPETPFEKGKEYKVEFLAEPCKDDPQQPPPEQALKPLTFKTVEEGSFPAGEAITLTQNTCNYQPDDQCDGAGVALQYQVTLPNALKIWTDMWQVRLLIDGKPEASTTVYGQLNTSLKVACEKLKSSGQFVVQMELALPGWGRSYLSDQHLIEVKCEEKNTCVQKATAKAGDPPPAIQGCGCQTSSQLPLGWYLGLLLLWPCFRRRSVR